MTIFLKTGAWTSRTTTGTDVITGLGFQPKVIIFYWTADFNTDDTWASDYNFRFGVATDTTAANQGSMAIFCLDGQSLAANTDTERLWYNAGALLREVGGGPTCEATVSAIGSDGFTVNWTMVDGSAHKINYVCIGGTDITNAQSGILTSPTATGNVSYTQPGFQPDFVMFWGDQAVTSGTGASMALGFATSSTNQVALAGASQNNVIATATRRYQRSDNVITFIELDAASPGNGAFGGALVSMDTNGFTCNWSTAAVSGQSKSFGYLAIKGGKWKVGSSTNATSATTKAVTGVGFQPVGLMLASVCNTSSTAINTHNRISFGAGSSSSNNRCVFTGDTSAAGTSTSAMIQKSAKCISMCVEAGTATSSTVSAEAAISTLDSDGFTLNWSTGNATLFEFLYIAVGASVTNQNVTKTLPAETITIGTITPTFVKTKAPKVMNVPAQTITFSDTGQPTKVVKHNKVRAVPAETITITGTPDWLHGLFGGGKAISRTLPQQFIDFLDNVTYVRTGKRNIVKALTETIHFSDSVTYIGKTKHTGDPGYWLPLKARITIYQFTDTTYSSPIYQYDPFTDGSGGIDKPIGLQFESVATGAGTFQFDLDNSGDTYDPDQFSRGNKVVVECSKDSVTWFHAFHGLVRSVQQRVFGPNNRIISVRGFSYLIRLNERILSARKEAAILGNLYDMSDSTMNTNVLLNDLLTNDANYAHSIDDTQLYSIFKTANIAGSPINDWIARIDAPLVTTSEAINSILEFSQSFLSIDYSNDQLALFNPDKVPSGGANAFLVTDSINLAGDSNLNTMYPIQEYEYAIQYDFADSSNRLIASIGNTQCPGQTIPGSTSGGNVGATIYSNTVIPLIRTMGSEIYGIHTFNQQILVNDADAYGLGVTSAGAIAGKVLGEINVAVGSYATTNNMTGTMSVGIRKTSSDDSYINFGNINVQSIPNDTNLRFITFTFLENDYVCQAGDNIVMDFTQETGTGMITTGVITVSDNSTYPQHNYNYQGSPPQPGWSVALSTYQWTMYVKERLLTPNTAVLGSIKLNGSTIQRVGVLLASNSALVGKQLGRITLTIRTGGSSPNGQYQVGIRRASDNTFIYFGGVGPFNCSTLTNDSTYRDINYDGLFNTYKIAIGDRISIEVGGMSVGYVEVQIKNDGAITGDSVQIYNGTTYTTQSGYSLWGTMYSTDAVKNDDTVIAPCGGLPETTDAEDMTHISVDANNMKRIGMVEQVLSNLPPHVKNFQTIRDYSYNKIYTMSKPRFTFDYPSVTLPAIMPKAGDICCHVSKKAQVGRARTPMQTGIITQVTYDFSQSNDSVLGLRRLSLTTTGILRGSY